MMNPDQLLKSPDIAALRSATKELVAIGPKPALAQITQIAAASQPPLQRLTRQYAGLSHIDHDLDEQLWFKAMAYLEQLDASYSIALSLAAKDKNAVVGQALLHKLEAMSVVARWYYLRYQTLPRSFWMALHATFQLAERATIDLAGIQACYLRVLMLDGINRTNMAKSEIVLVNDWLEDWCRSLSLATVYHKDQHLFYVDLQAPHSARRIRNFTPRPSYRYWQVDTLAARLQAMLLELEHKRLPPQIGKRMAVANAMRLVRQLLMEWSRVDYRRQRRSESRASVFKSAQAVHGLLNICQQVKNAAFADAAGDKRMAAYGVQAEAAGQPADNSWTIESESQYGFGARVRSTSSQWLHPGRLIALDYDLNPDMTVLGVVRSIQRQSRRECFVGIEVLSHTPTYVRLQQLEDISQASVMPGSEPFAALYLPADAQRKSGASLIMPMLDYIAGGFYQLRTKQLANSLWLGELVEQHEDWVRVSVDLIIRDA